jgi:hypothetical protein
MRRLITMVLLCALALPFLTGCPIIQQGGSTTQPVTNAEAVAAALRNYNYWLDVAEQWGKIAQGPNPSQEAIRRYNEAVWFFEAARAALAVMGIAEPMRSTPAPKMIVRHA